MLSSDPLSIQLEGWPKATRSKIYRKRRVSRAVLRSHRDNYLDELKRRALCGATNRFSDKAIVLLTRHWAKTHWNGRADLLRAAHWLICIGAVFHQ
jgi:hypothetical protein